MRKLPPALKHGAYSGVGLLPGEDANAFKALHEGLIREFGPTGKFEEDAIGLIARLMWRKQNLSTYRLADVARSHYSAVQRQALPAPAIGLLDEDGDPETIRQQFIRAGDQARKDLGDAWELIEVGKIAETESLKDELALIERLEGTIDRCLKRLLHARGLKSMTKPI